MWELSLPPVDDHLRQGDLLHLQPTPKRGTLTLTADGFTGQTKGEFALVLERCCSVEQKQTVQLARVGRARHLPDDHRMTMALNAVEMVPGEPFAFYEHALDDNESLVNKPGFRWIVQLLERVTVAASDHDQLEPYRTRRVSRMTVPGRAQLRAKLAVHWGRAEQEDADWLAANGFDFMGRRLGPTAI